MSLLKILLSGVHNKFVSSLWSKRGLIKSGPDAFERFKDFRISRTSIEVMLTRLSRSYVDSASSGRLLLASLSLD